MKLNNKQQRELNSSIRLNMDIQDKQLFGTKEKERLSIRQEKKRTIILGIVLFVLLIAAILLTNDLFQAWYGFSTLVKQLLQRANDIVDLILGNQLSTGIHFHIVTFIAPVLVGLALGSAGACYQGLFHNPMASPTMLGITSGGMLGATIFTLFFANLAGLTPSYTSYSELSGYFYAMPLWQIYVKQLFVMGGCFVTILVVLIISKIAGHGKISVTGLMIGGTVFATTISSILSLVAFILTYTGINTEAATEIRGMVAGQFSTISSPLTLIFMAIPMIIPMIILFFMTNKLNVIAFGEDEAKAMGVNVERTRIVLIIITTIMTGVTVAFCGQISFVGLMIPQLARFFVGTDYKYLLPASAFLGGITMLLAYCIYYTFNFQLSVGAYVNIVGSIVFFIMMVNYRRKGRADWT